MWLWLSPLSLTFCPLLTRLPTSATALVIDVKCLLFAPDSSHPGPPWRRLRCPSEHARAGVGRATAPGRFWSLAVQPTPARAIQRKTHCAQGTIQQAKPVSAEGALRPESGNATGNDGRGLARGAGRLGWRSAAQSNRPAPTQYAQGMSVQRRTPIWGLAKGTVTPGPNLLGNWREGECVRGYGRRTQWGQRPRRQLTRRWKLRRNGKRPVCCSQATGAC